MVRFAGWMNKLIVAGKARTIGGQVYTLHSGQLAGTALLLLHSVSLPALCWPARPMLQHSGALTLLAASSSHSTCINALYQLW